MCWVVSGWCTSVSGGKSVTCYFDKQLLQKELWPYFCNLQHELCPTGSYVVVLDKADKLLMNKFAEVCNSCVLMQRISEPLNLPP